MPTLSSAAHSPSNTGSLTTRALSSRRHFPTIHIPRTYQGSCLSTLCCDSCLSPDRGISCPGRPTLHEAHTVKRHANSSSSFHSCARRSISAVPTARTSPGSLSPSTAAAPKPLGLLVLYVLVIPEREREPQPAGPSSVPVK